jgi:hypothetical protein
MNVSHPPRDDAPEQFSLTRRNLMVGGVLLAGAVFLPIEVSAQSVSGTAQAISLKFMEVSSVLIDHHLDAEVGARMAIAMARLNSGIEHDIDAIIAIAKQKNAKIVEDFFPDIPEGHLKDTALAIISAWYTGVVENSADAEVFAFETALMYQPTHDVMTIPSYAISGPNGWTADAPPLSNMPVF